MKRRIGLIAIAVILALVGTIAVYAYAHNADKRALDSAKAAKVLIVQKQVPVGTSWSDAIKGGYFSQEKVPIDSAPASAVPSLDASIPGDEVANAKIESGQIVVREMFGSKEPTTGALAIPKGSQALSVSLTSNADVATFVQAGSQVAVYATFKIKNEKGSGTGTKASVGDDIWATKLLLPRVDVIAVNQDAPSDVNGGKDNNNNSVANVLVTLAVTQEQAERVILAQKIGELYMSLLSDTSVTAEDGGTVNIGIFKPTPIFLR